MAAGFAIGFDGTPSFLMTSNELGDIYELVGAQSVERFQEVLDALVAGEKPPADRAPAFAEPAAVWASEAGLAPDPDRAGFTVAGDPYKGDPDAPLVIIEFSDFQCEACRIHALDTQPAVDEGYVDSGKVLWVFKNFPAQNNVQAPAAAVAAECAGDQGRFYDMHHLLYETQADWSVADPDPVLADLGSQLGLDETSYSACLSSRAALERVLADLSDGASTVAGTPTFLFISETGIQRLAEAAETNEFLAIIDAVLIQIEE